MNILAWMLFGLITGVIANTIDPSPARGGMVGAIILGILGALLAGFLSSLIFGIGISGFNISSFAIAILGSLMVLFVGNAFREV